MAGLEVAGVVLGAIPLVISALEHYGDGVALMKNMRDFEYIFDDLHTQLELSVAIYMDSCYQLLEPLNLPDDQMRGLIHDRNRKAWSDLKLQKAIEERFGDNYPRYVSAVRNLDKRILLLGRKLKLDEGLKPIWVKSDNSIDEKARRRFFKNAWIRIKGGFDADKYASLVRDIDRDIEKISKLTSAAIQLEPLRAGKRSRLHSVYWQNVRDQAQRLFNSLSSRFQPCQCNQPHKANLRLDVRRNRNKAENNLTRFAFLLTFEVSTHGPNAFPWIWRDIEIECSECTTPQSFAPAATVTAYAKKSARFAPSITLTGTPSASPRSFPPFLTSKIENLCRVLLDGHRPRGCLGVLEDQPWQHYVYSVAGPGIDDQISETTSLKEIICGAGFIAPRQKCTLALTLASSVLQLHDTSWLRQSWDTQDIYILKSHSGTPIPSQFYVSQTFRSTASVQAAVKRNRLVKNEMVFALGVALLELSYGSPILTFKEPQDLNDDGKEDSMTKVSIASRLAYKLNEYESENYARAVLRCVTCNFDTFTFDFEDTEFKQKFYEGVVVPLQEDYEHATGTKI